MKPDNPQQPDGQDSNAGPMREERLAANQIGAAMAAPGMPAELRATLSKRLDDAFLATDAGAQGLARVAVREHTLEALLRVKQQGKASVDPAFRGRRSVQSLSARAVSQGRWGASLAIAISLAALLLISLSNRPSYNWDSMVEAIRDQPAVRVVQQSSKAPRVGQIVTRTADDSFHKPLTASVLHVPQALSGVLQPGEPNAAGFGPARGLRRTSDDISGQVCCLLFEGRPGVPPLTPVPADLRQEYPQIVEQGVLLPVQVDRGAESVRARFLLDPKSHLPLSCEVMDDHGKPVRSFVFDYPAAE